MLGLLIGLASHFAPSPALARVTEIQAHNSDNAYVQGERGPIARSPFGLCWRAGFWDPTLALTGCDGQLVPPVMRTTAPELSSAKVIKLPTPPREQPVQIH